MTFQPALSPDQPAHKEAFAMLSTYRAHLAKYIADLSGIARTIDEITAKPSHQAAVHL